MNVSRHVQQAAALCWMIVIIIVMLFAAKSSPTFDSSIMTLLPAPDQKPVINSATEKMAKRFSHRLLLIVSGENDHELTKAINKLGTALINDNAVYAEDISSVSWRVENGALDQYRQDSFPYRFSLLDKSQLTLLKSGEYQQIQDRVLSKLFSPVPFTENALIDDPFGFFAERSLNTNSGLNVTSANGLLKVTGVKQPTYLLSITLSNDPFSSAVQNRLLTFLESEEKRLAEQDIKLVMSGMLLHAAAGADQASREISTIGVGSLIGIIVLMLVIFRRIKPLLQVMLAVSVGCAFAASFSIIVFDKVHLVTFAFGAGLVGVSIDYALHYLCAQNEKNTALLAKLFPGLLLALSSSVIAYGAQAVTPFPGLRQMAVFSVVGLVASWLTVVLWFPLLNNKASQQRLVLADQLRSLRQHFPILLENRILIFILCLFVSLAMKSIFSGQNVDDIRLLQTSPIALQQQDEQIRELLGGSNSSKFLLISGDSLETCLQTEEMLATDLDQLIEEGFLSGYQLLSSTLPSIKQQKENIRLVSDLYQTKLPDLFKTLNLSSVMLESAKSVLKNSQSPLTYEQWLTHEVSNTWRDLILEDERGNVATVIKLDAKFSEELTNKLDALTRNQKDVIFIDQVENISDLLTQYRKQVIQLVSFAYLCVLIIFIFRYKTQVWRVMSPPLIASIFTLGLLVQIEGGINLFHLMALILVLGIGLDMGIFLFETNHSHFTWLAVSLSTWTSLLAFGLLALSNTPVLHHFGLTVLIGLLFVWLLAPLFRLDHSRLHN